MAWEAVTSDDGNVYYYNAESQETTWEKPEELFDRKERAIANAGWRQFTNDDGAPFWYNTNTEESVWETPSEIQMILDQQDEDGGEDISAQTSPSAQPQAEYESTQYSHAKGSFRSSSRIATAQAYGSLDKQHDVFFELLTENGVDETWTWEQAMNKLITDTRYWAVSDAFQRRSFLDQFQQELFQSKSKERKAQREEKRNAMWEQLSRYPVKYYSRWKTWKDELAQDEVFANVADERERRLVFIWYVKTLRDNHEEQQEKERKKAVDKLADLMRHSQFGVDTKWDDAKGIAENSGVNDFDALNTFEEYHKELERRLNDQAQQEKQAQYRKERTARDAFIQLLLELKSQGKIHVGTKWKAILPEFENDERYIEMCGQPGSSPVELFWDIVEEEEKKFKAQREATLDILASKRVTIEECHSFEKLARIVKFDPKGREFSDETLRAIFDRLKGDEAKKKESDRHAEERRLRRAQDDLRHVIKHLDPPVDVSDTWDKVKHRVADTEEYMAIHDDAARQVAFEKHIRRLRDKIQDERDRERERERRRRDEERVQRNHEAAQPRGLDEGPYMDY